MADQMLVNGYAVEEAPNGAWWVRHPGRLQQAWRFATRGEALRFARRRHPPATPPAQAPAPSPLREPTKRERRQGA
jgi:hypothetical protein